MQRKGCANIYVNNSKTEKRQMKQGIVSQAEETGLKK